MTKKYEYYETQETIDNETGEIAQKVNKSVIRIPQEEDYIKVYIKHINYLNNLPQGLDPLIYELLKYMNYGNKIVINSSVKREIAETLGKKFATINQYISKLVSYDILIRVDNGIYCLNPEIYGKGKWKDILELREELGIEISYNENKYTVKHKYKKTPSLFD